MKEISQEQAERIRCIVVDVDGTMTDGGIYYDEHGNELKKFNTRDAAGFFAAQKLGILTVVLTGRKCAATERRMKELKVSYLFENIKDKRAFLEMFMKEKGLSEKQVGYIGDDLNDLPPMGLAGFVGCPAGACHEVRERADYISGKRGGEGAVRDIIEQLLRAAGTWDTAVAQAYGIGI